MKVRQGYRYFVLSIFLVFMLLHQADKLLIGQLIEDVQETFDVDNVAIGLVGTGALIVAAIGYPIWGYLFDRFARARLLALASFIWGATTMLGAVAPTFSTFLLARGSTGVDDSSYPGLYSLLADYFSPSMRGKINGLLQLTGPTGFILSLGLVFALRETIGWRNIFLITGGCGILVGFLILFGVRDIPRGSSEPEMQDLGDVPVFRFEWDALRRLLRRRSVLLLYLQGFFGVFPFNVIEFWFFVYLGRERSFDQATIMAIMAAAAVTMSIGTVVAGAVGDALFAHTRRGRLLVCLSGVVMAAVLLAVTLTLSTQSSPLVFGALLATTAFFTLFSGPNIAATLYDITLPEVRTTALAVQYFIENIGAASAPLLVGLLSTRVDLGSAILYVSVGTLTLCALFLLMAVIYIPQDVDALRQDMRKRANAASAGM